MTLLAVEKISKKFNDQVILEQVSFTLRQHESIALVGRNGVGKTTLLEILAGKQEIDSGEINRSRACLIDYVEQEKTEYLDLTLFEFVADARRDLLSMRREIREMEEQLARNPNDNDSLTRLGALQYRFEQDGGFEFENEIDIVLHGLGFDKGRYHDRMVSFSGGEKNRAGLARLLAGKGNLLLLDEPTNHLDIDSTTWLEEYLTKLDKACIIVSHDRAFLDATVTKVWEIDSGELEMYTGGFENYLRERVERQRLAGHRYRHQQVEIRRIEDFIRRNIAGQKTRQAQSRLKYLNRIKRLPPPRTDGKGPSIRVQSSGRSYAHVLSLEDVWLGYGDRIVLENVGFDMYRGDKVGLIGRNGSGKSTLLKALIGELEPLKGKISLGNRVDVAYFDQELSDLNENTAVLDHIWEIDPAADVGKMRSFLARFGFVGEDAFKMVSALSGGEKTKLCLARLLYHPANLVILDEPTNHLDMYAREALESALIEYDGSCLIVSHDRFFLQRVADHIIYLDRGRARAFTGRYSEFVEKMAATQAPTKARDDSGRRAYLDFKQRSKRRAAHKKKIQSTRSKITELENELAETERNIEDGIPRHDWEKLEAASRRKKEVENHILELYAELDEWEGTEID